MGRPRIYGMCSTLNCTSQHYSKGFCKLHYNWQYRKGNIDAPRIRAAAGTKIGQICSVDGCEKLVKYIGLCKTHYTRQNQFGRLNNIRRKAWSGTIREDGRVIVQVHGYRVFEHIHIAERALGKQLPLGAIVHHIDENPSNNTPTNLLICPDQAYHMLLHKRMRDLGINLRTPLEPK